MKKDAIEAITRLAVSSRQAILKSEDGSGQQYLYCDHEGMYKPRPLYLPRTRSVSNIESFAALVLEEARRESSDGNWMTVAFSTLGAQFFLDDKDHRTIFTYSRELAPQWKILTSLTGKGQTHRDFVRLLQRLRPSIPKYGDVLQSFRKISLDAGTNIQSAPVLVQGKTGMAYQLNISVRGGDAKTEMQSVIGFELQYARGSAKRYQIEAEVAIDLVDAENDRKTLEFTLLLPDREAIEELAVSDEVAWFRESVKGLPLLSILEDY